MGYYKITFNDGCRVYKDRCSFVLGFGFSNIYINLNIYIFKKLGLKRLKISYFEDNKLLCRSVLDNVSLKRSLYGQILIFSLFFCKKIHVVHTSQTFGFPKTF